MSLGKSIQAARVDAELNQEEFAELVGISLWTLTKIERGAIKAPSVFTIKAIADALCITLDELMVTPALVAPRRVGNFKNNFKGSQPKPATFVSVIDGKLKENVR